MINLITITVMVAGSDTFVLVHVIIGYSLTIIIIFAVSDSQHNKARLFYYGNCLDAMSGFGIKIKYIFRYIFKNADCVERQNSLKGVDQTKCKSGFWK